MKPGDNKRREAQRLRHDARDTRSSIVVLERRARGYEGLAERLEQEANALDAEHTE